MLRLLQKVRTSRGVKEEAQKKKKKKKERMRKQTWRRRRRERRGGGGRVGGGAGGPSAAASSRIKINSWNTPTHHSSQPAYSRCPISTQPKYTKVHRYQIHKHKKYISVKLLASKIDKCTQITK